MKDRLKRGSHVGEALPTRFCVDLYLCCSGSGPSRVPIDLQRKKIEATNKWDEQLQEKKR